MKDYSAEMKRWAEKNGFEFRSPSVNVDRTSAIGLWYDDYYEKYEMLRMERSTDSHVSVDLFNGTGTVDMPIEELLAMRFVVDPSFTAFDNNALVKDPAQLP